MIVDLVATATFLTAAVTAAPAAPSAEPLTLQAAFARVEAASPLVRRARADRAAVAARQVGASQLFPSNPVVVGGAGPRRQDGPAGAERGVQYFLHAEQTVEIAGQRGARRAVVAEALRAADFRVEVARAETRARVRALYVGAQLAEARLAAARDREGLVGKLLDAVAARVESGASSAVDLEVARLERGSAARGRMDAELIVVDAFARLRLLVGISPGAPVRLDPAPALPTPRGRELPDLLRQARALRAELAAFQADSSELDAQLTALRREAIPSPTLFVELERDLPGQLFVGGGVALPIPVWQRQQGPLALARAERARVDDERAITEREIALEVERAFAAEKAELGMARLLEREVLPAADAAVALMTEGWRAGKFDLFRVIQTSRDAADAKRIYLDTVATLWESVIALDRAVGVAS